MVKQRIKEKEERVRMKYRKSGKIKIVLSLLLIAAFLCQGCGKEVADIDALATDTVSVEVSTTEETAENETVPQETQPEETDMEETNSEETNSEETEQTPPIAEDALATPAICGALHVEGTQLVDSNGNPVQLKGISTHGLAWFPAYVNNDCFKQLREDWNVNVMRLAMYSAEYGGYCSGGNKADLEKLISEGVKYATENDMYVIIDWHILSDNNPNTYKEDAKAFFAKMSENYADYNNVIYEICNEPNGGTSWSEVKSYAETIIPVIRENDEDAIILVGTPNWCQYVGQAAADPITGYDNIMYSLHFYASTHTDWLREDMKEAVAAGLPIFVSEYGLSEASGDGRVDTYQADLWAAAMDELNISYVAWNLSNKNESSSILKSSCTKTSGFTTEDLNEAGKWLYEMLRAEGTTSMGAASAVNENGTVPTPEQEENATPTTTQVVSGKLTYTATVSNSWTSGDKTFYQYGFAVTNATGSDVNNWSFTLKFNSDIEFDSGWNGNYSASGNVLTITPAAYNSNVPAGTTLTDIGFIISGAADLQLTE